MREYADRGEVEAAEDISEKKIKYSTSKFQVILLIKFKLNPFSLMSPGGGSRRGGC